MSHNSILGRLSGVIVYKEKKKNLRQKMLSHDFLFFRCTNFHVSCNEFLSYISIK